MCGFDLGSICSNTGLCFGRLQPYGVGEGWGQEPGSGLEEGGGGHKLRWNVKIKYFLGTFS